MKWLWLKGTSGCALVQPHCLSRDTRAGCPGLCPDAFWVSPRWETPQHPVPGLSQPPRGTVPAVLREPPGCQFVFIASGPVTGHHLEEPGSVSSPFLQASVHIDIPLNLLGVEPVQLSQPSLIREMCQSLNHLNGPLLDSLQ